MPKSFTMDGYQDLESVVEEVYKSGCFTGSPAMVRAAAAHTIAALLARLPDIAMETRGVELLVACQGMYDAAITDDLF